MYVYVNSERNLYTVGFYDPQGRWQPDSDYNSRQEAGDRVAYLNGSKTIVIENKPSPALSDLLAAAQLPRNACIHNPSGFTGTWVAIPEADFDALRAARGKVMQDSTMK